MGQRVSKQAGFIIIIKPDQRTGIKMRPGLTHNGCVEEFRGSKGGAHFICVNNLTPLVRQEGAFQPKQGRLETTRRRFQRAEKEKREINSLFSVLIIRVRASSLSAPTPCNLSLQKENCLFLTP